MGRDHEHDHDDSPDVESDGGDEKAPQISPGAAAAGDEGAPGEFALGCMPITRLALRAAEFVFSLICFSLLAAAQGPTASQLLKVGSMAFLLSFAVIAFVYSIATLVLLVLALMRPDSDLSYKLPRPLLIADFVLLLNLYAGASACASAISATCQSTYLYTPNWDACGLVSGASAMGFLASFTLMADFWLTLVPVFAEI